jgi:hypothetical protein
MHPVRAWKDLAYVRSVGDVPASRPEGTRVPAVYLWDPLVGLVQSE